MEVVAVDIPDPALEQVSQPGVGVFPDRNEEVRVEAGPVDAGSELVGETAIVAMDSWCASNSRSFAPVADS